MRTFWITAVIAVGVVVSPMAFSQTSTPVTATCKDGTDYSGKSRSGACRGHGGVQAFTSATAPAAAPASATTPTPQPPVAPPRPATTPTAGAPPGQVWVNTNSKVYHCPGTRYFGKTKAGAYMTEAAAKAEGDRPDHGKTCFQ